MRFIVFLTCICQMFSMTGFAAWPIYLVDLQKEWFLTNIEAGWISGSFFLGYVVATPFLVGLTDNYDARKFGRRSNYSNINKKVILPNWNDIKWIKKIIKNKPLFIKGIMDPNDAKKAIKYGADGIWVSNHGGRVFESNVSSLEMLPLVRKKIGKKK